LRKNVCTKFVGLSFPILKLSKQQYSKTPQFRFALPIPRT